MSIDGDTVVLFALGLLAAALATVLYYRVMWYVSRAGLPVKVFSSVLDTLRMFRLYKHLAPSRGWPLWPIPGFWLLASTALLLGIAAGLSLPGAEEPLKVTSTVAGLQVRRVIFVWICFASALGAVWFTYRVLHKVPLGTEGRRDWTRLFRDEYLRSDVYAAVLGWVGLLILYFLYRAFVKP